MVCMCILYVPVLLDCAQVLDLGLSEGVLCNHPCLSQIRPLSVFNYLGDHLLVFSNFGPRVYPIWSIVIALVGPSIRLSVFEYLRDSSLIFSKTLHEVGGQ